MDRSFLFQQSFFSLLNKGKSEFESNLDSPTTPPLSSGTNSIPWKRKTGRKKFRETRHPIYRGIRQRDGGKWICEVREPKKQTRIWVGTYPTPELAARAYDVAALALRGKLASLNFPDSAWLVPRAKSASAQDIRLAAFQATRFELVSSSSPSSSSSSSSSSYGAKSEEQEVEASRSCDIGFMGKTLEDSRGLFLDEEAIFNMPGLIASMAEGMLLAPPPLKIETCWDEIDERANSFIDLECLW